VSLLFFSSFAAAQVYATSCTLSTWDWTFNSLSQSPCTVAAYLMATCDNGVFTLGPEPSGYPYYGPGGTAATDLCYCNTVSYSLISACGACQGDTWIAWSIWATNCTRTLPPSSFPNPVPSEIRVPQWALIDVSNENYWNSSKSFAVGDSPEVGPGSMISAPPTTATAASTSRPSSTASPTGTNGTNGSSGGGSSNTGAIVGGVVGGIAAICIAVVAILYQQRRSQPPAVQPVLADVVESKVLSSPPEAPEEGTTAPSSLSGSPAAMKLYDPNDPTTFPGYQADLHSPDIPSQVTMSSNIGSGNAVANAQTTQPHAGGYHGHPIV